jgi:hypothetical protein
MSRLTLPFGRALRPLMTLSAVLALTACGGSLDAPTSTPRTDEVPESATASVSAFFNYLLALVEAAPSETDEPLGLNQIGDAPTSETEEATALN